MKKIKLESLSSAVFKKESVILFGIIILGVYLRFSGVLTNSFAFTYDVGRDMLALRDIASLVHVPFIGATTGIPGVFYGPWWYYMLTPFFILSGGNPQGVAATMALIGVATIIFSYLVGRKIGGEFLGLSFAALVSVSPVMISLSSQIWNPDIAPLFVLLILLILERVYSEKKAQPLLFFFLGILLTLCVDIEIIFGILFSIAIVISCVLIRKFKFTIREILEFSIGALIIFSPRVLFEVKNHFLMTQSLLLYFRNSSPQASNIVQTILSRAAIFLDQFSGTVAGGNKNVGIIIVLGLVICLLFLYKKASVVEKNFIKTSLIIFVVFFLGTTFFSHDIWPHYLVGLPVFYIVLICICLNLVAVRFKNYFLASFIVLLIFLINFNPIYFVQNLNKPLWEGDASVYRNQVAVIDYVYKQADGKKFKYVVYTPPVIDYTYQYLFKWYGPLKYKYEPSEQSHLAFLF